MLCFYILTIITFTAVDALSFAGQRSYGSMIFHMTGRAPTDYENYGCWCRTGSKPERYVDDVDLCCKFRFHCYDVALQSSKCNGIAAEYSIQLDRSIKCIDYNETCAYELCICDKQAVECFKNNLDKINDTFFNLPKKECRFEPENTTTTGILCQKAKWNSSGVTVATGEGIFSIFVDDNNNIYTAQADFYNQRVLKNSSDGKTVYQVVDFEEVQSATNWREQFRYPTALFVDNMENLYAISSLGSRMQSVMNGKPPNGFENIVTYYGYTVEKLTRGSTKQVRVAELKNAFNRAKYSDSYGLFVDQDDNIYISDQYYHYVLKFSPDQNSTEIVAGDINGKGNGSHQLNEPTQIYVNSFGDIYIADSKNHRIQKWVKGAKEGITVAGGNGLGSMPNQLNAPKGVWVDVYGNVFVCDTRNQRIQKWSVNANVGVTVAGDYSAGSNPLQLRDPQSLTLDSQGNIYVADTFNRRVQKFVLESPTTC